MVSAERPPCQFLGLFDVAGRLKQAVEASGGRAAFGKK